MAMRSWRSDVRRSTSHQAIRSRTLSGGIQPRTPSDRYHRDHSGHWVTSCPTCMGTYQKGSMGKRMSALRSACQMLMSITPPRVRIPCSAPLICLRLMCSPTSRQWAVTKSTVTCLGVSPIVYSSVISSGWPSGWSRRPSPLRSISPISLSRARARCGSCSAQAVAKAGSK